MSASPTDIELNAAMIAGVIGTRVYPTSNHKPGSRPYPHAWRWRHSKGDRLMIFDGVKNTEFNALAHEPDARHVCRQGIDALLTPPTADLTTADGRRALCEALHAQLAAAVTPPAPTFAQWLAARGVSTARLSARVLAALQDDYNQEQAAPAAA